MKKIILLLSGLVVIATTWASINGGNLPVHTPQLVTEDAAKPETTTLTLPSKTSNVWEMPQFALPGLDGTKHSLQEWKGKVIVFNFWASWCSPCQYEIRDLVQMQDKYKGQGLQVIGVGVDEERKLRNVSRTLGINYPILVAEPSSHPDLLTDWGNSEQIVPYTVIIDTTGHIHYIHRGQMSMETFQDYVLPLLNT